MDGTIAPDRRSWVPGADGSDRPLQHLPWGAVRTAAGRTSVAVAIGDRAVLLVELARAGLVDDDVVPGALEVLGRGSLDRLLAQPPAAWAALRLRLADLLDAHDTELAGTELAERAVAPLASVTPLLPVRPPDYVDFYCSEAHATHVGELFRPDGDALLPNWKHLPVGYHGRAGTVVVSGTDVVRPRGQRRPTEPGGTPTFGPTERLDLELELGVLVGGEADGDGRLNPPGVGLTTEQAADAVLGVVLVDDWSARDVQAWEYQPLGPFLGKSFATSVAAWVTPAAALAPAACAPPAQDPPPLPHLAPAGDAWALDLEVVLEPAGGGAQTTLTRVRAAEGLYWTFPQMLAHLTSNGAALRPGDLVASGTVSGWAPGETGCLLERTRNGAEPVVLADGTTRTWLEDGDTVLLRGSAAPDGHPRIGLAPCRGTVVPAR
ncbi:MAG: fumarylacetoacetase [Actinomycetes bacterium]